MEEPILLGLLLVDADGLLDVVHLFLKFVNAAKRHKVSAADGSSDERTAYFVLPSAHSVICLKFNL